MTNTGLENAYAYAAMLKSNAAQRALPRYIRRHQLRQIVPLADTTIYEMELRDEFPRRILLTSRVVAWELVAVEAWIEQRKRATRDGKAKCSAPDVRKRKVRPVRA